MELSDVQALAENLAKYKDEDFNEETTKHSLIVPFVQMLGYNTCNPSEVRFEYTAAFGVKKGDRVDVAILHDDAPILIIECKPLQADLDMEKRSQLSAYFAASVGTRIGLLTNGRKFQFFSDLDKPNLMDNTPFLSFDLLNFDQRFLPALQKISKATWDLDSVIASAVRLKRLAAIKALIWKDATEPTDDVVKHYANACYKGMKVQSVIDEFRPLVVQAFKDYILDRLKPLIDPEPKPEPDPAPAPAPEPEPQPAIVTHDSEQFAYVMVKTLLSGTVDASRVQMHDYKGFCAVQLDGTPRKTICRFKSFEPVAEDGTIGKYASIEIFANGKDSEPAKHQLGTVEDILPFKEELAQAVRSLTEGETA